MKVFLIFGIAVTLLVLPLVTILMADRQERAIAAQEQRNKEFTCKALVEAGLVRVCSVN